MPKVGLHQLAQSGATDGQAPLWSDASGEYVPGTVGGGGSALGWFNVKDPAYGALGDGTTDDTAAINLAIAALNTAGRGVLYFPAGIYKTTAALTAINVPCTVLGDGCADALFRGAPTTITSTSATAVLFTLGTSAHGTRMIGLSLVNTAGSTPTAGAAIQVLGGDGNRYLDLSIKGFYINVDVQDGGEWYMDRCFLYGPVKYAVKIQHIDLPDGGDMGILNSQIIALTHNADAAVRWETGGGLRFIGNKVNVRSGAFALGIDAAIQSTTAVLTVAGNSIEGISGPCVKGSVASGQTMQGATIVGNEFGTYTSITWADVDITGWKDVAVVGNTFVGQGGGSTQPAIKLSGVTNGAVGLNAVEGFTAEYSLTSCTNITLAGGVPTSRLVSAGTGLTGGGDLSADRTLAIDTTAETERIQDVVGAMVVAGTNVTATYNDPAGTLTIAASGGSSGLRLAPMTTTIGGGDPQLVFTENGEVLMVEVPA